MTAYYNEWDPYPAQWLRNLILAGLIAPGDVDERSIKDVRPDDLKGYTQCHFFAGIGGWSYALRLANWGDERPVWTGSCPCQPFSAAGKGNAQSDERHLWPTWFKLIASIRPISIFGEQVAAAIAYGWVDDAFNDLEKKGYQTAAAVLPACSVGAPHKRDRLFFVADSTSRRWDAQSLSSPFGSGGTNDTGSYESGKNVRKQQKNWRESEPNVGRMAYGIPKRMGQLCAYGNAIVPQVAQAFIEAFMEVRP